MLAGSGRPVETSAQGADRHAPEADRSIRRIVEHGKNYLVPRDDGRILIGATEEDAGFDTRTTPEAFRDLLAEAHRLCPILERRRGRAVVGGLEAGERRLEALPRVRAGFSNLIVATGHKRAGLQLAPASAEVIADLVLRPAPTGRPRPVPARPRARRAGRPDVPFLKCSDSEARSDHLAFTV